MSFLKISNANVSFGKKTLMWKSYTTNKILSSTKQVQIVNPKKFVIAALDMGSKTFVIYMAIWKQEEMPMHSQKQAQVGALIFNEAPTEVLAKYFNYNNVFSMENAVELLKYTRMNEHTIKLEKDK